MYLHQCRNDIERNWRSKVYVFDGFYTRIIWTSSLPYGHTPPNTNNPTLSHSSISLSKNVVSLLSKLLSLGLVDQTGFLVRIIYLLPRSITVRDCILVRSSARIQTRIIISNVSVGILHIRTPTKSRHEPAAYRRIVLYRATLPECVTMVVVRAH